MLGLSVDSVPCLKAWADNLGGISYPLLSDFYPHGRVAQMYGVFRTEGYSERAIIVIDQRGTIRYVDVHDISQQPDNEELFRVLAELGQIMKPSPLPVESAAPLEPAAGVVLYCTPWCPDCGRVRAFLKKHGVSYVEVNVARDREAAARLRGWTGGYETTPTLDINGMIVIEFQKERVAELLGIEAP